MLAVVGGLCWLADARFAGPAPPPAAAPVDDPVVVALGRVEPFGRTLTIVPATGVDQARIAELNVREGAMVRAGQVVATLDTAARQQAAVKVAEANLMLAQSALDRIKIESENQVATGAATVARWQAERDKAAWDVERTTGLATSGFGTKVNSREAQLALAQSQQQLAQAAIALARAKAVGSSGDLLDVEAAKAQVEASKAQLAQAQALHAETQVRAPGDGQVLKIFARVGERVGDHGIMSFGQTAVMAVRAEVYATEVGRLSVGAAATAATPALAAPLRGVVAEITPMVESQSIVSADPAADTDARIVDVRIRLDEASSRAARDFTNLQLRVSIAARDVAPVGPVVTSGAHP